uniref:G-protein coupled receptors family 1 profile domain-containing protein n=1 Tax=Romanomermis culicivorax TaxID=13658 RepID=A0A915JDD6_ROMCU
MEVFSYSMFYGCWMVGVYVITFYFYYKIYKSIRSSRLSQRMIAGGGKAKLPAAVSTKNAESVAQAKVPAAVSAVKSDKTAISSTSAMRHEVKFVKTSFKIFLLFVSFWSPTALLILLGENSYVPKAIYLYALWLAHSNSTMNFFIYYMDDKRFRVALWAILGRMSVGTKKNRVGNQDRITPTGAVEKW